MKLLTAIAVLAFMAITPLAVAIQPENPGSNGKDNAPGQQDKPEAGKPDTGKPDDPGSNGKGRQEPGNETEEPVGPQAPANEQAKAYGRFCQDQSKRKAEGERKTPFAQCVTAMAKLAHGDAEQPKTACKDLSRKHVEGEKGTPFSRCVAAAKRLNRTKTAA